MAAVRNSIFKKRTSFMFFLCCVFDLYLTVACITVVNKSDPKIKREETERISADNSYRKNEVKPLYGSKTSTLDYSNARHKDKDIKDRITVYNTKERDNAASSSGYDDREEQYGLYAPDEQAYQGYGYQDFDQTPHYGLPQPTGLSGDRGYLYSDDGYKDHREHYGYGFPQHKPDHHALALKGILIPLAGVALLGAAAALVTNPILLQLGVISGRRKRALEEFDVNLKDAQKNVSKEITTKTYLKAKNENEGHKHHIERHDNVSPNKFSKIIYTEDRIANTKGRIRNRPRRSLDTKNADESERRLTFIPRKNRNDRNKITVTNSFDNFNNDYEDLNHGNSGTRFN